MPGLTEVREGFLEQKIGVVAVQLFATKNCYRCSIDFQQNLALLALKFFNQKVALSPFNCFFPTKNWHFCHSIVFYNKKLAFLPFNFLQQKIGVVENQLNGNNANFWLKKTIEWRKRQFFLKIN
jgi:hypothetical protein